MYGAGTVRAESLLAFFFFFHWDNFLKILVLFCLLSVFPSQLLSRSPRPAAAPLRWLRPGSPPSRCGWVAGGHGVTLPAPLPAGHPTDGARGSPLSMFSEAVSKRFLPLESSQ